MHDTLNKIVEKIKTLQTRITTICTLLSVGWSRGSLINCSDVGFALKVDSGNNGAATRGDRRAVLVMSSEMRRKSRKWRTRMTRRGWARTAHFYPCRERPASTISISYQDNIARLLLAHFPSVYREKSPWLWRTSYQEI